MKKLILIFLLMAGYAAYAQSYFTQASGIQIGKVNCFLKLSNNNILIGSDNGLFCYSQGNVTAVLPASIHGVSDMAADNSGFIWLATLNVGLVKMNSSGTSILQAWNPANSVIPYELKHLETDAANGIWVGSDQALWLMNGTQFTGYSFSSGSILPGIKDILNYGGQTFFLMKDSICIFNGSAFTSLNHGGFAFLSATGSGEIFSSDDNMMYKYNGTLFICDSTLSENNFLREGQLSKHNVFDVLKFGNEYYIFSSDYVLITANSTPAQIYFPSTGFYMPGMKWYAVFSDYPQLFIGFSDGFLITNHHYFATLENEYQYLDLYRMRAPVLANGSLFNFTPIPDHPVFEAPKGTGKSPMYIAMPWMAGLDQNNQLHLAAQRYTQIGHDFFPGTLKVNSPDPSGNPDHARVWKVSRQEIEYHASHWNQSGYATPEAILSWPGNGNSLYDEAPVLAPFADINQNGYYEPSQGEYPIIRGEQAIYFIYNDAAAPHTESGGEPLGIEVHGMAYVMRDTSSITGINNTDNTIFLHYTIINRSQNDYHQMKLAMYSDIDIGYPYDDYAGCDTLIDSYFIYNEAGSDSAGTYCPYAYSDVLPAMGVTFLSHKMQSFVSYNNMGMLPGYYTDPAVNTDYWNVMNGLFKDGTPMTYGGSGYGGTIQVKYMFPGSPDDPTQWSDMSAGNLPHDRRGVGVVQFDSLGAGQSVCLDFAYVYDDEVNGTDNTINVALLKKRIGEIRTFFFDQQLECLYYEHNFMQTQTGSYVDTLMAFVDTCVIDPYTPVDAAWISGLFSVGNTVYVDWVVVQQGDTFYFDNVPYALQNSGNQLFVLVLRCMFDGRGSQTHYIYLNASSEATPEQQAPITEWMVYPNPAAEYITVVIPDIQIPEVLQIINVNGQVVDSYEVASSSISIPVAWLASGIYLMHAVRSNESLRFFIQKN
ncbi:hypothetical protein SDC9_53386 [bioreactor metagenome]|uniref:Secretion system C-terminal sorting domain-containing protein n=1 Tax=bioreactor metagenome TaxID=1076179 RepID=A0A644WT91_9ZZZZ